MYKYKLIDWRESREVRIMKVICGKSTYLQLSSAQLTSSAAYCQTSNPMRTTIRPRIKVFMSCNVPQTLHREKNIQQQIPDTDVPDVQLSYKLPRELAHNHLLVLSLTSLNHTFPVPPFHNPRWQGQPSTLRLSDPHVLQHTVKSDTHPAIRYDAIYAQAHHRQHCAECGGPLSTQVCTGLAGSVLGLRQRSINPPQQYRHSVIRGVTLPLSDWVV